MHFYFFVGRVTFFSTIILIKMINRFGSTPIYTFGIIKSELFDSLNITIIFDL